MKKTLLLVLFVCLTPCTFASDYGYLKVSAPPTVDFFIYHCDQAIKLAPYWDTISNNEMYILDRRNNNYTFKDYLGDIQRSNLFLNYEYVFTNNDTLHYFSKLRDEESYVVITYADHSKYEGTVFLNSINEAKIHDQVAKSDFAVGVYMYPDSSYTPVVSRPLKEWSTYTIGDIIGTFGRMTFNSNGTGYIKDTIYTTTPSPQRYAGSATIHNGQVGRPKTATLLVGGYNIYGNGYITSRFKWKLSNNILTITFTSVESSYTVKPSLAGEYATEQEFLNWKKQVLAEQSYNPDFITARSEIKNEVNKVISNINLIKNKSIDYFVLNIEDYFILQPKININPFAFSSYKIIKKSHKYPIKGRSPHTCTMNGHEYVDLGLPSGTMWATNNYGAAHPIDCGLQCWAVTYEYACKKGEGSFDYGIAKLYKSKDNKLPVDCSFARQAYGYPWQRPTDSQWLELIKNCQCFECELFETTLLLLIGPNGNHIILPKARYGASGHKNIYDLWNMKIDDWNHWRMSFLRPVFTPCSTNNDKKSSSNLQIKDLDSIAYSIMDSYLRKDSLCNVKAKQAILMMLEKRIGEQFGDLINNLNFLAQRSFGRELIDIFDENNTELNHAKNIINKYSDLNMNYNFSYSDLKNILCFDIVDVVNYKYNENLFKISWDDKQEEYMTGQLVVKYLVKEGDNKYPQTYQGVMGFNYNIIDEVVNFYSVSDFYKKSKLIQNEKIKKIKTLTLDITANYNDLLFKAKSFPFLVNKCKFIYKTCIQNPPYNNPEKYNEYIDSLLEGIRRLSWLESYIALMDKATITNINLSDKLSKGLKKSYFTYWNNMQAQWKKEKNTSQIDSLLLKDVISVQNIVPCTQLLIDSITSNNLYIMNMYKKDVKEAIKAYDVEMKQYNLYPIIISPHQLQEFNDYLLSVIDKQNSWEIYFRYRKEIVMNHNSIETQIKNYKNVARCYKLWYSSLLYSFEDINDGMLKVNNVLTIQKNILSMLKSEHIFQKDLHLENIKDVVSIEKEFLEYP